MSRLAVQRTNRCRSPFSSNSSPRRTRRGYRAAWEIVYPVIKKWESEKSTDFPNYDAGSVGPAAAAELLARDKRHWYDATDQAGCKIKVKDTER